MYISARFYDGMLMMKSEDESLDTVFENSEEDRAEVDQILDNPENDVRIEALKSVYENTDIDVKESADPVYCWIPLTREIIEQFWGSEATIHKVVRSFADLVNQKQTQIKSWCEQEIVNGITVDVGLVDEDGEPLGPLHYSLTDRNQSNMRDLVDMIAAGATEVTWRDTSRVTHMVYTAKQFMALYQAAKTHIYQCRFRSDGLEELLFSYTEADTEAVEAITWKTELPEEIQQKMNLLLDTMLNANAGILSNQE